MILIKASEGTILEELTKLRSKYEYTNEEIELIDVCALAVMGRACFTREYRKDK